MDVANLVTQISVGIVANLVFFLMARGSSGGATQTADTAEPAPARDGLSGSRVYLVEVGVVGAFLLTRSAITGLEVWSSLQGQQAAAFGWLGSPALWVGLLIGAILSLRFLGHRSYLSSTVSKVALTASIIVLILFAGFFPAVSQAIQRRVASVLWTRALDMSEKGNQSEARRRFSGMLSSPDLPRSLQGSVQGRLAKTYYDEGDYVRAIDQYARVLEGQTSASLREAVTTSIVWSIARLGLKEAPSAALVQIQNLAAAHPHVSAIQPIFLVVGPDMWAGLHDRPGASELRDPDFLNESEKAALRYIAQRSDRESFRESRALSQFLLGDFTGAIQTTHDSDLLSWALFQRGEQSFDGGSLQLAANDYRQLIERVPESMLCDDAALRLGRCQELQHSPEAALQTYERGMSIGDGNRSVDLQRRIVMVVELASPPQFDELAKQTGASSGRARIDAVYRRLVAMEDFAGARDFATRADPNRTVIDQGVTSVVESAARLKNVGSADAEAKLGDVYRDSPTLTYADGWGNARLRIIAANQDTSLTPSGFAPYLDDFPTVFPPSYYAAENHWVHAANHYELSMSKAWSLDVARRLLVAYLHLAQPSSFLASSWDRAKYSSRAQALADKIESTPLPTEAKADVQAQVALAHLGGSFPQDFDGAIEAFQRLVTKYPTSHLANNSLKWIGWCYEQKAQQANEGAPEYVANYRLAATTYERILRDYPTGHVAKEARARLDEVESLLAAWKAQ